MKNFLLIILMSGNLNSYSQVSGADTSRVGRPTLNDLYNGADIVVSNPDTPALYPGGNNAWIQFLKSGIDPYVPIRNKVKPGIYQVIVRFFIDQKGKLVVLPQETHKGFGMEEEVIKRLLESPIWQPAKTLFNDPVGSLLKQTVLFIIKEKEASVIIK